MYGIMIILVTHVRLILMLKNYEASLEKKALISKRSGEWDISLMSEREELYDR